MKYMSLFSNMFNLSLQVSRKNESDTLSTQCKGYCFRKEEVPISYHFYFYLFIYLFFCDSWLVRSKVQNAIC